MAEVIQGPEQLTVGRLNELLARRGDLESRGVRGIQYQQLTRSETVATFRLVLDYAGPRPDSAPQSVVLKLFRTGSGSGQKEASFYGDLSAEMDRSPAPRCYEAIHSSSTGWTHLVLPDLGTTHFRPEYPLPPEGRHLRTGLECLARFHAFWWNHPRLLDLDAPPAESEFHKWVRSQQETLAKLSDFLGDRLSDVRREWMESALEGLPELWGREGRLLEAERPQLTLVHGDLDAWKFAFPVSPERHRVRLLEWQNWRTAPATDDVADLLTLHWPREGRRRLESDLVGAYHAALLGSGVEDYPWEQCWHDYRVSTIRSVLSPLGIYARRGPAMTWWPRLQSGLCAFEDLYCLELI